MDNEVTGTDLTGDTDFSSSAEPIEAEVAEVTDEAVIDDSPAETETEAEAPAEELFELKVDGQVVKLTKDELIKEAQKAKAAEKRMQAAAKEKQDALRLIELAKQDPMALLRHLNPDLDEKTLLSTRLGQLMEDELLSPEERQQKADLEELQKYRQLMKQQEEQKQQEELQRLAAEQQQVLDTEIAAAIQQAGLPRTKAAVKRVAEYMLDAIENGLSIPVEKIAAQVKKDMQEEVLELLQQSDEESFETLLGKDLLTKAQKLSLKKVKAPGQPVPPSTAPKEKTEKPKRETPDDFLRAHGIW